MKAEELMIGDIVLHENEPYFIRKLGIFGVDRDGNDYPAVCIGKKNGIGLIVERNEINPIPLTPEILEKNGFKIEIAPYTPDWMRCIFNPNFFLEDRLKGFYHFNGNNLAKIQYVHELQHALKLCGIEKEIEL